MLTRKHKAFTFEDFPENLREELHFCLLHCAYTGDFLRKC